MIKIIRKNGLFTFSGTWYGSVGETFDVEYNEDEFIADRGFTYEHSFCDGVIPPGGDRGKVTYTLRPQKKGVLTVTIVEYFRGEVKHKVRYRIIVL